MMFSAGFLTVLVYGALGWCAVTSVVLIALLIKEGKRGQIW